MERKICPRRRMPATEASSSHLTVYWSTLGTFFAPHRFLRMMNTFTLLSFVVTFLAGATAGTWLTL